jgi:hypothetical protein
MKMDIGKEDEPYTIEPIDDPVPADDPYKTLPAPVPEAVPEGEPVPA